MIIRISRVVGDFGSDPFWQRGKLIIVSKLHFRDYEAGILAGGAGHGTYPSR